MRIELVNTGTELCLGDVINTNAAWIGQRLAALGLEVARVSGRRVETTPWTEEGILALRELHAEQLDGHPILDDFLAEARRVRQAPRVRDGN